MDYSKDIFCTHENKGKQLLVGLAVGDSKLCAGYGSILSIYNYLVKVCSVICYGLYHRCYHNLLFVALQ